MTILETRTQGPGPQWPQRPTACEQCGVRWQDEFAWIRHAGADELGALLATEDAHTEAFLAELGPATDRLTTAMLGFIAETDSTPPAGHGPWEYLEHTRAGEQYSRLVRRPRGGGPEQLIVDVGALAAEAEFLDIGGACFTPSQARLALLVDTEGDERYTVRVYDASQCPITPETPAIETVEDVGDLVWIDEAAYCYIRYDDAWRAHEVWRHRVGRPTTEDELVFAEADPEFNLGVTKTSSERYLEITTSSATSSESWLAPVAAVAAAVSTAELQAAFRCFARRQPDVQYHIEHFDPRHLPTGEAVAGVDRECFLVLTNDAGQEQFGLWATANAADWTRGHWRELLAAGPDRQLEGLAVFGRHVVVAVRTRGALGLVLAVAGPVGAPWAWTPVELPGDSLAVVSLGANEDYDTEVLRCYRSGPACPDEAYDYMVHTGAAELVKRYAVPAFSDGQYTARRVWIERDGVEIPVTVAHRRDLPLDGSAPALVVGYGAYDDCYDVTYDPTVMPLLADGWVYAVAHIRGGGELGRRWWHEGRGPAKVNTFLDFDAVLRGLIAAGYATAGRIVVRGRSAGGLVAGNAVNRSPELLAGVIAEVPFVDALNTMCDPSLPLVIGERDEWGDPLAGAEPLEALRAWAPYEQVAARPYPPVLLTGGLHDPRVGYWEPLKFAARLRARTTGQAPIIVKIDRGVGHFGPTGRYDAWREEAEQLAFAEWAAGLGARG